MMLAGGGVLAALGAYGFVFNIWRTIDGRAAQRAVVARVAAASTVAGVARSPSDGGR
jgi:hypothetical protein